LSFGKKRKEKKRKKMASPPVSSSAGSGAQVLRCLVLFNGTNYCDWVPHMWLHMRDLRLWEFLGGELPCPPLPIRPVQPVIPTGTSEADQKKPQEYDDIASYMSHFWAYQTLLDEGARAGAVLVASVDLCLAADVRLDHASQMWPLLRQRYDPFGQSTYITILHQE
jgi:hypothetical protein